MNRLTSALADYCQDHLLTEKWLLTPSLRVGHQWLETVARGGQPAVNVHLKTLRSMAVDLAAPEMAERRVTLAPPRAGALLVDRALQRLDRSELTYLAEVTPTTGLAETIYSSLDSIRLAGVSAEDVVSAELEVGAKGGDLAAILELYLAELAAENLVDYADVLRMAVNQLHRFEDSPGAETLLLLPADVSALGLEQQLLEKFPDGCKACLPVDEPADAETSGDAESDLELLRWIRVPASAPAPISDGTAEIMRCVGEAGEVREVLRRALAGGIPLDQIELLHTDRTTYVPLVHETLSALERSRDEASDELPVTFAEGLPCWYSRPGRSLAAWLQWIQQDFPQDKLVSMIREGLLEVPVPAGEEKISGFHQLAAVCRTIGIGMGRQRYAVAMEKQIAALDEQLTEAASRPADEDETRSVARKAAIERRMRDVKALDALIGRLLQISPDPDAAQPDVVSGAIEFLERFARRTNKLDQFAADRLIKEIRDMAHWLDLDDGAAGFDVWSWLADLPGECRVLGSGPKPGCLHVDSIYTGGHSGRRCTFIIGLDDGRFPGTGLQDPLLLDSERRQLSSHLATASGRMHEAFRDFSRLLARLRGQVVFSFPWYDVVEDRERFPSPVLLTAYRILAGKPHADQGDLLESLPAPASYAPAAAEKCLDVSEWWLWRLCGSQEINDPEALVDRHFPHLGRGADASRQRHSEEFTVYDGRVEQAGQDLDPTLTDGRVMSANSLQTAGRCPLAFFYQYGLGLALPDELKIDPDRWLDPLAFGSLLHTTFERFVRELVARDDLPQYERDFPRLRQLLHEQIEQYRGTYPPPSENAYHRQCSDLDRTIRTFLREEERFCAETGSRPAYLETSLGMAADGDGSELDMSEPIPVTLPNGKTIRIRGRIDRIDRIGEDQKYAIWDYKSGSTYNYEQADPFRAGRVMQPFLYVAAVTHHLRGAVSPDAQVTRFGFFFPGVKADGARLQWERERLSEGASILENLTEVISSGAFLATNDSERDCGYCDFSKICGDTDAVAQASQRKLVNPDHSLLIPIRGLRDIETEG